MTCILIQFICILKQTIFQVMNITTVLTFSDLLLSLLLLIFCYIWVFVSFDLKVM